MMTPFLQTPLLTSIHFRGRTTMVLRSREGAWEIAPDTWLRIFLTNGRSVWTRAANAVVSDGYLLVPRHPLPVSTIAGFRAQVQVPDRTGSGGGRAAAGLVAEGAARGGVYALGCCIRDLRWR